MKKLLFTMLVILLTSVLISAQYPTVSLAAKLVNIFDITTSIADSPDSVSTAEISIGDSLTNGHQDTNPSSSFQAYPHLLATLITADSYKVPQSNAYVLPSGYLTQNGNITTTINGGIESQRLDEMISNFNGQVLFHRVYFNATTVTLLGGTNNTPTDTPDQIYQKWQNYAALCSANNIKLRIMTLPALRDEPYKSVALAANAQLRANHSFAAEFVDLARNKVFTDASNSTYYQADGVHLKTAANQKIAELIRSVRNGTYTLPVITTASLPNAVQNAAYSQTLNASNGATAWEYKSGTLPGGITFNAAARRFEGTPTQTGTFGNIVVWAIDANGNFDEKTYSLTVNVAINPTPTPTPIVTPTPTPNPTPTPTGTAVNYALTSQGSTAVASSTYAPSGYDGAAANAIDGDRLFTGSNWGYTGGIYHSYGAPANVEVNFNQSRTIQEIDVVTVRDSFTDKSPVSATENFSAYGITDFKIEYWNGSAWVTVQTISGNTKVWRQITFAAITTTKIRVSVTAAASYYARIAEIEAWGTVSSGGGGSGTNYALTSQGSTAVASSTYAPSGYDGAAANAIDGDRLFTGSNWGYTGGIYHSYGAPANVEVNFNQSRTIQEIDVVTVRDSFTDKSPVSATENFSAYGITDFKIEYWNGSAWVTVQTISGNTKVWRQITFAAITTTKIRVSVTAAASYYARITEIEAWGGGSSSNLINCAATSQGSTAVASSTYAPSGYDGAAANAIDGDRLFTGSNWGYTGGIYHSYGAPANVEVNFNQSRTIQEIDVVTVRDSFTDKSPVSATENFSAYGITDFKIEYWNGSAWVTVQTISGNTKVWRQITFAAITTTKIRVSVTAAASYYARIAEIEAWGN